MTDTKRRQFLLSAAPAAALAGMCAQPALAAGGKPGKWKAMPLAGMLGG